MKKLVSLAMLATLLLAAGCDDDKKQEETKPTCPSTCTNGCEADGTTCKVASKCPESCTNGCEADGITCKATPKCPESCTNGCEDDGITCKTAPKCPESCTNGCEDDGITCKAASKCPESCTNGCEADGITCKQGDNTNLDDGIVPVPANQPASGKCDADAFVNHCNGNKKVSCYGDSGNEEDVVHEEACENGDVCVTIKEDGRNYNYCLKPCTDAVGTEKQSCDLNMDDELQDILVTQECRNSSQGKVWHNKSYLTCSTVCSESTGTATCVTEDPCTDPDVVTCDENNVATFCDETRLIKYVVQCRIWGEDVPCVEDWGCDDDYEEEEEEE
ncbi:MAG: hypothetical protein IJU23_10325, partial [Proteobacteria bacterium]|nr:hypothetical protein [Pseudomonadota bacterium]